MNRRARVVSAKARWRDWGGYALFAGAVGYALYHSPDAVWRLQPAWLLVTVPAIAVMIVVQVLQLQVFLRHHRISPEIARPALFTVRRLLLNAVLPARAGTFALLHFLRRDYGLPWSEYLRFSLVTVSASFIVSALAAAHVLLGAGPFAAAAASVCIGAVILARTRVFYGYLRHAGTLLALGAALYGSFLLAFWSILVGLGHRISFAEATYFAILLNILAQTSVTPGNLGVREALLGATAPLVSLPVAAGILAGTVYHVSRVLVSAVLLAGLEHVARDGGMNEDASDLPPRAEETKRAGVTVDGCG